MARRGCHQDWRAALHARTIAACGVNLAAGRDPGDVALTLDEEVRRLRAGVPPLGRYATNEATYLLLDRVRDRLRVADGLAWIDMEKVVLWPAPVGLVICEGRAALDARDLAAGWGAA